MERTLEIIERFPIHGGPCNGAKQYFNNRLKTFRQEHPSFDSFLIELSNTIRNERIDYCNNILRFIDGDAETNWITPGKCLFITLIDLYNLCLSSKQAFDYIKECYKVYQNLLETKYDISNEYRITNRTSRWNGKNTKFIQSYVVPDCINDYYFKVEFNHLIVTDNINDISNLGDHKIELIGDKRIYQDALMLFEYYQSNELRWKVLFTSIKGLIKKDIVKYIGTNRRTGSGMTKRFYRIKEDIGYYNKGD